MSKKDKSTLTKPCDSSAIGSAPCILRGLSLFLIDPMMERRTIYLQLKTVSIANITNSNNVAHPPVIECLEYQIPKKGAPDIISAVITQR